MREEKLTIRLNAAAPVTALWTRPDSSAANLLFAYAPGAGSNLHDPFGAFIASELARARIQSLRFQFPYMEAGKAVPDRNPVLESCWLAALETCQGLSESVVIGGRSMGGRIASQIAAHGAQVAGLVLFAYPLHPPGQPEKTRDEHLPSILVPTLFCSGTRDAFATPEELESAGALVGLPTFHFIVGADHGFNVPKSSGVARADVWDEAFSILLSFLKPLMAN